MILQRRLYSIIFTLLFLFSTAASVFAQSGIYVGGHFRRERNHTITDLKASGFTYVILFNVNIETNGDLTVDGETICRNGTYVFGNTSPNYVADVNALKQGTTSINRVEFCVGGWGNHSYANIRSLINRDGTGTNTILYRNFRALKNAIPSVDAINNDDEEAYDVNSATAFHVMMADIGYKTTLAPYMNRGYWQSLATNVNNQRGGAVDKIYLQWYEGGAGNNPCDWRINNIEMHTGDLYYENATNANNKMTRAKNDCGSKGGFFWVYNDNNINLRELAGRVNTIYNVKPPINPTTGIITTYKDVNYTGFSGGFSVGDYNLAALRALGVEDNSITSLKVKQGYKVTLYFDDNFTGQSMEVTSDNGYVGNTFNDQVTSLRVRPNGVTNLGGIYVLQNKNSGLNMDVWGASTANGAGINQGTAHQGINQQFTFTHLGEGLYKIIANVSGKSLDVNSFNQDNGARIEQYTYNATDNQQFIAVATDVAGCYKLVARHSGKIVEVAGASKDNGAIVQQWDNNNQACGQWNLLRVTPINGNGDGLTGNYFNGMNFETPVYSRKDATLNFEWGSGSPNTAVSVDDFSARWTGQIQPRYTGEYTFYTSSDNGRRLWINGQLIIDRWVDDVAENTGKITLTAGQKYNIKLEYFENYGGANMKLEWSSSLQNREVVPAAQLYSNPLPIISITAPANNGTFISPAAIGITVNATDNASIAKVEYYNGATKIGESSSAPFSFNWANVAGGNYNIKAKAIDNMGAVALSSAVAVVVTVDPNTGTGDGLTGNYFNGMNFETPVYSRKDGTINFDWGGGSPHAAVNADQFSVRWTGQIQPKYSGEYTFYTNTDNGRRLWINDQLVIDKWIDDWNIDYSGKITLTAGVKYNIKLEYFENNGGAACKLEWSHASQVRQVIPTLQLYSNALPATAVTSPANNTSLTAPASIVINANASDNGGSIVKVEFYNGTVKLGEDNSAPYSYSLANAAVAAYALTTRAIDNLGGITVSSTVNVTVKSATPPNQAPSASLTSPVNGASFNAPASVNIIATASDADGTISKVEFYNGAQKIGEDASAPYSYTWTNVTAGTYSISVKAFDNSNTSTNSSAVSITVKNVVTDVCSGIASYVENGNYAAGSKVKNASRRYECKEFPYSGWCNGAAWAYAPGTGAYWTDAWYDRGACSGRTGNESESVAELLVSPNPSSGIINIHTDQNCKVSVYNSQGMEVISSTEVSAGGHLNLAGLTSGIYLIKIDTGSEIKTSRIVKN